MSPPAPDRDGNLGRLLLATAAAAVLLFLFLGRGGLTDPDESAYAESVREMAEKGDWLVPHLYGRPLLDKPILFYWAMGASFRVLGETEFAARLPSALAALAQVLVVYRLGCLVHGSRRAGLLSALTLATSLEFVLLGRAAVTDMILTAFCSLGILCFLETLLRPGRRALPLAGAACFGLAVLTKGPVGLVIPGAVLLGYLAATGSLQRLRELRPAAGTLVVAAVALPWYGAIGYYRPDLVREFLLGGNLGRFLSPEHRSQSPLYYLVVLLVGFLPWSTLLPGALARTFRSWKNREAGFQLLLLPVLWLILPLAFFTLAASKLPSYILPAFPAAALLAAAELETWFAGARDPKRRPGAGAMSALVLLAGALLLFAWRHDLGSLPPEFRSTLVPLCAACLLGALGTLGAFLLGRPRAGFFLLLAGSATLILYLVGFGLPRLEPWKSSRTAAALVAGRLRPSDAVLLYHENNPGFAYYLRRVPELPLSEPDLAKRLAGDGRLYGLMERDRYEKLKARWPGLPLYLVGTAGDADVVTNHPLEGSP